MSKLQHPSVEPKADYHSGFIGLIGKPNVGKSTMLNYFLERKIAITSPVPQTTRHRLLGILTRPDAQIVFIDSPGWHKPEHPLGRHMATVTKGVLEEADILTVVIDATSGITKDDEHIFDHLRRLKRPALLAVNKMDLINKPKVLPLLEQCAALNLFQDQIPISAVTGDNMPTLLNELVTRLPQGPRWFEPDQVTDQTTELMIREFIREGALQATRQEVPHAVGVLLDELTDKGTLTVIHATILVEREGQKAILIGKKGQMLKKIGTACRGELERWLGHRVFLGLWVKVAKDWRNNPVILQELGYLP